MVKDLRSNSGIYIVGIGPGEDAHITFKVREAILFSEVIVGYKTYLALIPGLLEDKEIVSTGMGQEVDRCKKAIELALQGKKVTIVSSGDAGIYGMAGLVFELLRLQDARLERGGGSEIWHLKSGSLTVEVIPGIPAFCAAAALLGAPIMDDFACISLSDILTPWETILKRIEAVSESDFIIVLYNPKSKQRTEQLSKVIDRVLRYRHSETPVGIVRKAARAGEDVKITALGMVYRYYDSIDMSTTIIIGNSRSFVYSEKMVTKRGYKLSV